MLALGFAAAPALAFAQPTAAPAAPAAHPTAQRDARALFEQGRAHAAAERWVEALEAFQASLAQTERPSTLFNIAAALVRLGRAREALAALDRFDALSDPRRDATLRADATALRRTAEGSLRHITLRVTPPGARVEVDGREVDPALAGAVRTLTLDGGAHTFSISHAGWATERFELPQGEDAREVTLRPLDGVLVVESSVPSASISVDGEPAGEGRAERSVTPGPHQVGLRAEGYVDFVRAVDVPPGERVRVEAALEPLPREPSLLKRPLFWGAVAGGVAAVVVGAVLLSSSTEPYYGGNVGVVLAPLRQP